MPLECNRDFSSTDLKKRIREQPPNAIDGEEDLALRVPTLVDAEMKKIGEIAGRNATTGGVRLIGKALASGGRVL